jgi:hypothetical protein
MKSLRQAGKSSSFRYHHCFLLVGQPASVRHAAPIKNVESSKEGIGALSQLKKHMRPSIAQFPGISHVARRSILSTEQFSSKVQKKCGARDQGSLWPIKIDLFER